MTRLITCLAALFSVACARDVPPPPESTVTLLLDGGATRTALGPLRRVERAGRCVEGALFEARSEDAALTVCVPHDPAAAPHGHVSYYATFPRDRHRWHHAALDASVVEVERDASGRAFVHLHGLVRLEPTAQPASLGGGDGWEARELRLLGVAALRGA